MPRYRQVIQEDGSSKFVEIGGSTGSRSPAIHGPIEAFVSPVDGSVISDRKSLREHNERHRVTNTADFGPDHLRRKADERRIAAERDKRERGREIYERTTAAFEGRNYK